MNTLTAPGSNYLAGVGLDTWKLSARQLAAALGAVVIVPGSLWLPAQARWAKGKERLKHRVIERLNSDVGC